MTFLGIPAGSVKQVLGDLWVVIGGSAIQAGFLYAMLSAGLTNLAVSVGFFVLLLSSRR